MRNLRVFAIDNSIMFQNTLVQELTKRLPSGSLVEHAGQPAEALDKMAVFKPDIIVLNFALGSLMVNQEKFLPLLAKKYSQVPIITYGILESGEKAAKILGAAHYLKKPSVGQPMEPFLNNLMRTLLVSQSKNGTAAVTPPGDIGGGAVVTREIWRASRPVQPPPPPKPAPSPIEPMINVPPNAAHIDLIAIGASTGGTEALSAIITKLEPPLPGIVIVQHIPPMFSKLFAARLDEECKLHVKEAEDGDIVKPNCVYIAPGSFHMTISRNGGAMKLTCKTGPRVHGCCPSVDVLFKTVAEQIGDEALGVILTGMGRDGADGLLMMKQKGSPTLGQDKDSSVVYGMPRAAWEAGAVDQQFPLQDMASAITRKARD